MLKPAKPSFSLLLDGQPAAKFDARQVLSAREFLAKRREARRAQPFIPIQVFGLALNDDGPGSIGARAVKPTGVGIQTQN